jgi:chorismate dehydratase
MTLSATARIGMVNFINTAPLYEVWKETVVNPNWKVTEASPAELNHLLNSGKLDLGFISSHEYALHSSKYKILDNLSISASGPVGSVFLFSQVSPDQLTGCNVMLSTQSQTSVSLVKILLEEFLDVKPFYIQGDVTDLPGMHGHIEAVMAIGDDALRLDGRGDFPFKIDLAELWKQYTDLPFVFAVWAVRQEFFEKEADCVYEIHRELLRCVETGKKELDSISKKVAPRIPMDPEECRNYLQGIEYDLNGAKQMALERFFAYLIQRGEVDSSALPLKIIGSS